MHYRIVPDRDDVQEKLSPGQRKMIWQFAPTSYSDIVVAACEADRLGRVWRGIRWHVLFDDTGDPESWARVVMKYRAKGVFVAS